MSMAVNQPTQVILVISLEVLYEDPKESKVWRKNYICSVDNQRVKGQKTDYSDTVDLSQYDKTANTEFGKFLLQATEQSAVLLSADFHKNESSWIN